MIKEENRWLQWAVEIQSLAQAGLAYGRDPYDRERYERLREIAAEMVAHRTEIPVEKVKDLFCNETGYQTPKVDTRVKETLEEAGLRVRAERLIAVQDRNRHNAPRYAYGVMKVFVLCSALGGEFVPNIETTDRRYFARDELPEPLAEEKASREQIMMCFDAGEAENWRVRFD